MTNMITMNPIQRNLVQTQSCTKAGEMLKMSGNGQSAEPRDTVERGTVENGFWGDVKRCARKGADISSHAFGGFGGLALAGTGVYIGVLGGALGAAYLGGGLGLLRAAVDSQGFLDFWKTVFNTTTAAGKIGMVAGGIGVGYGCWEAGKGVGSTVMAVPGYIVGGLCGVGVGIANKVRGEGGDI